MSIRALFIANRGEIADRIIKAAKALGIRTIQAASEADTDALACRLADEVVVIGPAPATKSYLDIEALVQAIRRSGADAVHPGYGFLSENPRFVSAIQAAGLSLSGLSGDHPKDGRQGDGPGGSRRCRRAVLHGSDGRICDLDDAGGWPE